MDLLDASVRVFVEALTSRPDLRDSVEALASEMLEAARRAGSLGLERAVETLKQALPLEPAEEAHIAIVLGALVELGANVDAIAPTLIDMLARVFPPAQSFIAACEDVAEAAGEEEITPAIRAEVAKKQPTGAAASTALDQTCLGALSVLTRSHEARELARSQSRLELRARALAPMHKGARLVWVLLSLLEDEELLVLDPAEKKGWRVHLSGVADNRQLHVLLGHVLPGARGARPSEEAVVVATSGDSPKESVPVESVWTFYQWRALQPDGTLPEHNQPLETPHQLVPHLGVPAQIDQFEGVRTLLVGPPRDKRSWNANRIFHELHPDVRVTETLSPEAAKAWLSRIATTH